MKRLGRHSSLIVCAIISLTLFITFLVFQYRDSTLLKLESKWLIVAGVPILIGLIIGSYIKSFKGFGVELESLLELSIGKVNLIASDAIDVLNGDEKRSFSYLEGLSDVQRRRIQRLTFTVNRPNYYQAGAIYGYLSRLRNLKYLEVQDSNKKFQALIPIRYFKSHGNVEQEKIQEFIQALENNNLIGLLGNNIITDSVSESDPLLDVLKKVRNSSLGVLPVVSSSRVFIGVVTDRLIEKRIADEVITMQSKAA
jgi:hypothetical protein